MGVMVIGGDADIMTRSSQPVTITSAGAAFFDEPNRKDITEVVQDGGEPDDTVAAAVALTSSQLLVRRESGIFETNQQPTVHRKLTKRANRTMVTAALHATTTIRSEYDAHIPPVLPVLV